MQNYFFLEHPESLGIREGKGDNEADDLSVHSAYYASRDWLFRVQVPNLLKGETVCVTGDLKSLGKWVPENCVPLQQEDETDIWSTVVSIPDKKYVEYRFCICVMVEKGIQVIVRSWETNLIPRRVGYSTVSPTKADEPLIYGFYNDTFQVDRGWLTKESMVQLKFLNNPLTLWTSKYAKRTIYLKVTPVNIRDNTANLPLLMSENLEESLSDTGDGVESSKFAFTDVADFSTSYKFVPQGQFGIPIPKDNMLIFQSTVLSPKITAYLLDFYVYSREADENDPPYHIGFSYLLPTTFQSSEGSTVLPVTSSKQRPLGEIHVDYLIIGAVPSFKADMKITYARHWKKDRCGLDVGHRGSGSSFINKVQNCAEVRENTIASLTNAIIHGADFVEFDVQLSKDLIPIIYHDFHVCIAMRSKNDLSEEDMLEIPLKDLTFEQLRMLKVYHLTEGKSRNQRFFDNEFEDNQPFPSLEQAFQVLRPHVGFNIEIKWTMKLANGSYELYHPTDLNLYLDIILEVVMRCAGTRRVVFSCFNPDICQVLRMKQNKYPVMFLTIGDSSLYPKYFDPRCWSIKAAIQYASIIEILGINVHTEDLLKDVTLIQAAKEANLVVFCWGDDNANKSTIKHLKELGLHGIIYDKIHEHSNKEVKESIFLLKEEDTHKTKKELIQLAAAVSETYTCPSLTTIPEKVANKEMEQLLLQDQMSTATSLESLESIKPYAAILPEKPNNIGASSK